MPKISVIIPVYKAENHLRKCVESIVLGEEQNLEVILVEDCSPDESWNLCQQLAQEYPQVRCLRNERNSGVSHTRNRGLDAATGQYVLFVDSDDWVSSSYAKTLIETQEANPGKFVVCAYHFIDHVSGNNHRYDLPDVSVLKRQDFLKLLDAVLLQQLWNKVFSLDQIRKAGIRFDETISMGEDYQFVMDVLEAADQQECVIVHRPLYYYIRWSKTSLMSTWSSEGNFKRALECLTRMSNICGIPSPEAYRVQQLKNQYRYSVAQSRNMSGKAKREALREIMGDEVKHSRYLALYKQRAVDGFAGIRNAIRRFLKRVSVKLQLLKNARRIRKIRRHLHCDHLTVISQNCIGGVFSHDMNLQFQSPTVNLFIPAADFIKFVNNLEHYLAAELQVQWGEEYPVGRIDDVQLHFVHYGSCQQARVAWERRKQRVDLNKVLVLSTDRDGFDAGVFEQWKAIRYPKLLFTARREFSEHPDVLYFPEHEQLGCIPDLIPKREFYKGNKLMDQVNKIG